MNEQKLEMLEDALSHLDEVGKEVNTLVGILYQPNFLRPTTELFFCVLVDMSIEDRMQYSQSLAMIAVGIGPSWCSIMWHWKSVSLPSFRMPFSPIADAHISSERAKSSSGLAMRAFRLLMTLRCTASLMRSLRLHVCGWPK